MSSHYRTLVSSSAKGSHKTPLRTLLAASDSGGGGTHDNPNVQEFQKNMQALQVVNSFVKGPVKGNCRGSKEMDKALLEKENCPLPKRKPAHRRK